MPPKPRLFDQLNLGKEQKKRVEAVAKLSAYDVNRIQRRWTRKFRGRVLAAIEEHTFLLTFPCTCTSVFKCVCTWQLYVKEFFMDNPPILPCKYQVWTKYQKCIAVAHLKRYMCSLWYELLTRKKWDGAFATVDSEWSGSIQRTTTHMNTILMRLTSKKRKQDFAVGWNTCRGNTCPQTLLIPQGGWGPWDSWKHKVVSFFFVTWPFWIFLLFCFDNSDTSFCLVIPKWINIWFVFWIVMDTMFS